MKKINWKLLETHKRNYDGTCVYCGKKCTDENAISAWATATEELGAADWECMKTGNARRLNYLQKRIDGCKTYKMN